MNYFRILALALALMLLGSGCSLIPFHTPEEQRAQLEATELARQEALAQADPHLALQTDLMLHRQLVNSQGAVLADYEARFPYFSKKGSKAQSFARVNEYYQNELAGLNQDAESFFASVKAAYGEGWDAVTAPDREFSVLIGYEVLDAPEGYLSVQSSFAITENGVTERFCKAQVFLMDNGWFLPLSALLGEHYEEAQEMLLDDIFRWCDLRDVPVTGRDKLSLSDFERDYALTTDGFIFYTLPFQMSNKDPLRYAITIPLTKYRSMIDIS